MLDRGVREVWAGRLKLCLSRLKGKEELGTISGAKGLCKSAFCTRVTVVMAIAVLRAVWSRGLWIVDCRLG
jgi:hypothetical protein